VKVTATTTATVLRPFWKWQRGS